MFIKPWLSIICTVRDNPEDKAIIQEWKEELRLVKRELKVACNPHFGSIFRTHRDEDGISNNDLTHLASSL